MVWCMQALLADTCLAHKAVVCRSTLCSPLIMTTSSSRGHMFWKSGFNAPEQAPVIGDHVPDTHKAVAFPSYPGAHVAWQSDPETVPSHLLLGHAPLAGARGRLVPLHTEFANGK